jgi:hypothetical protein
MVPLCLLKRFIEYLHLFNIGKQRVKFASGIHSYLNRQLRDLVVSAGNNNIIHTRRNSIYMVTRVVQSICSPTNIDSTSQYDKQTGLDTRYHDGLSFTPTAIHSR